MYGHDQQQYQLPQGCGSDPPLKVEGRGRSSHQPFPLLLLLRRTQETEALIMLRGDMTRQVFVLLHTFYSRRPSFPPVIRFGTDKLTGAVKVTWRWEAAPGSSFNVSENQTTEASFTQPTVPHRVA